jgi:hypothetical protein
MFCTVPATRPSAYSILSKGRAPCEDKLTIELTKKKKFFTRKSRIRALLIY